MTTLGQVSSGSAETPRPLHAYFPMLPLWARQSVMLVNAQTPETILFHDCVQRIAACAVGYVTTATVIDLSALAANTCWTK